MTILVYGAKAGRTHENQMLQAFLDCLEERWATSTDWILVIANGLWSGAEIDLVCILPSAILVADCKSHSGELTGTENGPWQADGVLVKGGRKANPYQQLRDNKFSLLNWLESKKLLPGRNLGHIAAAVVFSDRIDDQLELPPKVRSWFYPTDLKRCATLLDGLASPSLNIDRKEAEQIVQRLGVEPITWNSTRPQVRDLETPDGRSQRRRLGWEDVQPTVDPDGTLSPRIPDGTRIRRPVLDDTLSDGPHERVIEYVSPFATASREDDYRSAWAYFEKQDASSAALPR
jgi:hypothetical protein